jgi:hypothetical protein
LSTSRRISEKQKRAFLPEGSNSACAGLFQVKKSRGSLALLIAKFGLFVIRQKYPKGTKTAQNNKKQLKVSLKHSCGLSINC